MEGVGQLTTWTLCGKGTAGGQGGRGTSLEAAEESWVRSAGHDTLGVGSALHPSLHVHIWLGQRGTRGHFLPPNFIMKCTQAYSVLPSTSRLLLAEDKVLEASLLSWPGFRFSFLK